MTQKQETHEKVLIASHFYGHPTFYLSKINKKYQKTGNKHPLSVPVLPTVSRLACPLIYLRRARSLQLPVVESTYIANLFF
jgi:hypothetical protein